MYIYEVATVPEASILSRAIVCYTRLILDRTVFNHCKWIYMELAITRGTLARPPCVSVTPPELRHTENPKKGGKRER